MSQHRYLLVDMLSGFSLPFIVKKLGLGKCEIKLKLIENKCVSILRKKE
jgi:hypothetical protein